MRLMNLLRKYVMHTPHPSRLCRDTVPVAVPGALLGVNACVAHRPQPLAQVA